MTHAERKALREKHHATPHKILCTVCREEDGYPASYPCDAIRILDYLDLVDPMPRDDLYENGFANGFADVLRIIAEIRNR